MRAQHQMWSSRKKLVVFLAMMLLLMAIVVGGGALYSHLFFSRVPSQSEKTMLEPMYFGLKMQITSPDINVSKDRFIEVNTLITNPTAEPVPRGCVRQQSYYIDGTETVMSVGGLCQGSSISDFEPGDSIKDIITIDPSTIPNGIHSFYGIYDGSRTNTIHITVAKAHPISNCYALTEYASPLCSQIQLSSTTYGPTSNHDFCPVYLDYVLTKTPLRPLAAQKHITCDAKSQFPIPRIVANVPKGDPDHWIDKLEKRYSANYVDGQFVDLTSPSISVDSLLNYAY